MPHSVYKREGGRKALLLRRELSAWQKAKRFKKRATRAFNKHKLVNLMKGSQDDLGYKFNPNGKWKLT